MAAVCPAVSLPSGYPMPAVGLGTFDNLKENEPVFEAVKVALDSGYRLIDGAYIYRSEDAVGKAIADRIQAGVVRREDLFVTTKLWGTFHQPDRVEQGLRASLEQLGLQWVDLCLMHWPMAFQSKADDQQLSIIDEMEPAPVDFVDTWKAMEELVVKGLARSIGISNFNIEQLTRLLKAPLKIRPANIQIESHPLFLNQELIDFCVSQGIPVTAYSPLGRGGDTLWREEKPFENLLENQRIVAIAAKNNKTPAQVVLRWALQRGIAIVPKSCTPSRIKENFQIFDFTLSDEDMAAISAMNQNQRIVTLDTYRSFPEYPF